MNTTIETYQELKQRHQKEVNDFEHIFFAFDTKQFNEGMAKIGLNPEDKKLIVSIGMGGFILKSKAQEFKDIFKRHDKERKQRLKDEKVLIEGLVYELGNHEYCYSWDKERVCNALGLTESEIPESILNKAIKIYKENCSEFQ